MFNNIMKNINKIKKRNHKNLIKNTKNNYMMILKIKYSKDLKQAEILEKDKDQKYKMI